MFDGFMLFCVAVQVNVVLSCFVLFFFFLVQINIQVDLIL